MLQKPSQSRTALRATIIRSGVLATLLISGVVYLQSCNRQPEITHEIEAPKNALDSAENMPEPTVDIPTFMGANIKYPEKAKEKNIEGRVVIRFIVDEEGNVTSPTVKRSPDPILTEEALRVIKLMPKWRPGTNGGKKVAVYFTIPISFKLS